MRAALLREDLRHLHVEDVVIDRPEPEEILIETAASGLCHSDLHFVDGDLPGSYPLLLGHEASGIVRAVGDDVAGISVGDHVITCLSVYCGRCDMCLTGRSFVCRNRAAYVNRPASAPPRVRTADGDRVNLGAIGAYAEEVLVHQNSAVTIVPEMPLDRAAVIGCAVMTGVGGVFRSANVRPASTVAVVGCGGVGMATIQGAHLAGARQIIAVDLNAEKLEAARSFGATHTVDASTADAVEQVLELSGGGVDYSFECIGHKATIESAYAMVGVDGLCTVFGVAGIGVNIEIPGQSLLGPRRLQGSMMGSNNFKVDMPHLCELYLAGRLDLDSMISRRISLDEIDSGFADMRDGTAVRTIIEF